MPDNLTIERVCEVVESALKTASSNGELSSPVEAASKMGSPKEWDSLAFVVVFNAIAEEFDVELEDDDAIHLTSIQTTYELLCEIAA